MKPFYRVNNCHKIEHIIQYINGDNINELVTSGTLTGEKRTKILVNWQQLELYIKNQFSIVSALKGIQMKYHNLSRIIKQ